MPQTFDPQAAIQNLIVYTDGACSGNPGPGGWGAVVVYPEGKVRELGGQKSPTTNNEMELTATIEALRSLRDQTDQQVFLFTDSTYVIRGITQWVWAWKKRQWKTAEGEPVSNKESWERLVAIVSARGAAGKVHWIYSRGHVGIAGNERCDEIAVAFSKKHWVDLYEGPLLQYSVAVHDFPTDTELPEMRPKTEKKVAYSYLSYLNGTVVRHKDWASCERRTKGQSGAKFKKAETAAAESEILKGWSLPENHLIRDSD